MSEYNHDWGTLFCILFHEIKKNECTPAELENLETQAFRASEDYCKKHKIPCIYSQTSVGARARFFRFAPGSWTPLDGMPLGDYDAYQESGEPAGQAYIVACLDRIKNEGPATPAMYVQTTQLCRYLTTCTEHGLGIRLARIITTLPPCTGSTAKVPKSKDETF